MRLDETIPAADIPPASADAVDAAGNTPCPHDGFPVVDTLRHPDAVVVKRLDDGLELVLHAGTYVLVTPHGGIPDDVIVAFPDHVRPDPDPDFARSDSPEVEAWFADGDAFGETLRMPPTSGALLVASCERLGFGRDPIKVFDLWLFDFVGRLVAAHRLRWAGNAVGIAEGSTTDAPLTPTDRLRRAAAEEEAARLAYFDEKPFAGVPLADFERGVERWIGLIDDIARASSEWVAAIEAGGGLDYAVVAAFDRVCRAMGVSLSRVADRILHLERMGFAVPCAARFVGSRHLFGELSHSRPYAAAAAAESMRRTGMDVAPVGEDIVAVKPGDAAVADCFGDEFVLCCDIEFVCRSVNAESVLILHPTSSLAVTAPTKREAVVALLRKMADTYRTLFGMPAYAQKTKEARAMTVALAGIVTRRPGRYAAAPDEFRRR